MLSDTVRPRASFLGSMMQREDVSATRSPPDCLVALNNETCLIPMPDDLDVDASDLMQLPKSQQVCLDISLASLRFHVYSLFACFRVYACLRVCA